MSALDRAGSARRVFAEEVLLALACVSLVATASVAAPGAVAAPAAPGEAERPLDLTAACDGERDAAPALQSALDATAAASGGALVVPSGRTCRLAGGVTMRSGVGLRCSSGARLVVTATDGVALSGSELRDASIDGCTIVLAGGAARAIDIAGGDLRVQGVRILVEGERSDDGGWLARLDCRLRGSCRVAESSIRCARQVGRGLAVSLAEGAHGWIRDSEVRGCVQGIATHGSVSIAGNVVHAEGDGSVAMAVQKASRGAHLSGNEVRANGKGAVGIAVAGVEIGVQGNRAVVSGDGGVAFRVTASHVDLVGNVHVIRGVDAIGYQVSGSGITIGSCSGRGGPRTPRAGAEGEGRIHVSPVDANQVVVTGCTFFGGAYGVAQSGPKDSENVTVSSNRMTLLSKACIVATTGFVVTDNYCAWLTRDAHAVLLGDHRRPGAAMLHGVISGNLFQCMECSALLAAPSAMGRCRSDPARLCRTASDCRREGDPEGGACDLGRLKGIVLSGNTFLGAVGGIGIDLGGEHGADAATVANVLITGNQFSMRGDCTAIAFPSDAAARGRIRGIEIGLNSATCPTYVSGFDERMGHVAIDLAPGRPPPRDATSPDAAVLPSPARARDASR